MVLQTTVLAKRLALKMQQATVKQLFQQSREDIQKMEGYLQRAQAHANRQARPLNDLLPPLYCTLFWFSSTARAGLISSTFLKGMRKARSGPLSSWRPTASTRQVMLEDCLISMPSFCSFNQSWEMVVMRCLVYSVTLCALLS